ncbi:hypothetical protein SEVIR_6G102957v4 [Setaria viridis]|uniref:Uncharacterized protein n=1 Tax=Setaria viridis TaxID=4556 RepID=A0A4U6U711_SETVI|nr:hypothetical protein SEVIR_6G102957v2 [Setaria viridis]
MTLEVYRDELARLEGQARSCYAHTFEQIVSAEFVRMLLLDACYVLVRFGCVARRRRNGGGEAPSVGGDMMEAVAVVRDALYLAENQIPFFVVDKVHRLTFPDAGVPAAEAITGYVRELLRGQEYSVATPAVASPPGTCNLLHLTPTALSPRTTGSRATGAKRPFGRWRTATEYHCAGVGFRIRPLGAWRQRRRPLDPRREA